MHPETERAREKEKKRERGRVPRRVLPEGLKKEFKNRIQKTLDAFLTVGPIYF